MHVCMYVCRILFCVQDLSFIYVCMLYEKLSVLYFSTTSFYYHTDTYVDVMRKIWSFVYDMLEERRYIREVLPVTVSNTDMAILDSLPIIGDSLMGEKWANLAVFVLFKYFQEFSALKDSNLVRIVE